MQDTAPGRETLAVVGLAAAVLLAGCPLGGGLLGGGDTSTTTATPDGSAETATAATTVPGNGTANGTGASDNGTATDGTETDGSPVDGAPTPDPSTPSTTDGVDGERTPIPLEELGIVDSDESFLLAGNASTREIRIQFRTETRLSYFRIKVRGAQQDVLKPADFVRYRLGTGLGSFVYVARYQAKALGEYRVSFDGVVGVNADTSPYNRTERITLEVEPTVIGTDEEFVVYANDSADRIEIEFEAESRIQVFELKISGEESARLTQTAFKHTTVDGSHVYTGNYSVEREGNYSVFFTRVIGEGTDDPPYSLTRNVTFDMTPPSVRSYSVTDAGDRRLNVSLTANEQLGDMSVEISGPESISLDRGDFTESRGEDGRFVYEATVQVGQNARYRTNVVYVEDTSENRRESDAFDIIDLG
ncbi:MAG: hypothetical protein ABEH56_06150 [Salinirussus sp.]